MTVYTKTCTGICPGSVLPNLCYEHPISIFTSGLFIYSPDVTTCAVYSNTKTVFLK